MLPGVDFFDDAATVIGAIVMAVTGGWSLIRWLNKRAERRNESLKEKIGEASQADRTRLGRVEAELKRVEGRVTGLETRMIAGFEEVEKRMTQFERELMTVARKDDLHALGITQAKMDSRLATLVDNDKRLHDMLASQGRNIGDLATAVTKKLMT